MGWLKFCAASLLVFVVSCGGGSSGGVPTLTPTPPRTTPVAPPPANVEETQESGGPIETPTPRVGGAQDAPNRLFVDLAGGNDAADGKRKSPYLTLGAALNRAASLDTAEIFVSGGQINGTHNIASNVRLYGGFDRETWEREGEQVTSIVSSGYALNITADGVRVDGFTLQTTGTVGMDSVAVLVTDAADVAITNSTIISANAGSGAAGKDGGTGKPGADGQPGEHAGTCFTEKEGGQGGQGASGNGGNGGNGTPKSGIKGEPGDNGGGAGGGRGNTGGDGKPGANGENGTSDLEPGMGGDPFGSLDPSGYTPAAGKEGSGETGDGKPGGGGGGGGGGGRSSSPCGAGGGGGGAGGIGSKSHGTGGEGGGMSVGVLILNADVRVVGCTITTGRGGAGGRGGNGGLGGPGGNGAPGGERQVTLGAGGAGGDGGRGGDSAPGGGGGGGPSIGVLGDETSNMSVSSTTVTLGGGGPGGAGGAPASSASDPGVSGAEGLSQSQYHAPAPEEDKEDQAP
jgi:hypothetical protein